MILTKICKKCGIEKPISEYHKNKQCTYGVVGTCKPCYSERINKWYSDNRRKRQEIANKRNRSKKQQAVDYFGGKCHDCGKTFQNCVFQFHHLNPKEKDVNPSYAMAGSEERMWIELKKCIMLCANCHIIRHSIGKEGVDENSTY